ncbi:MAG: hypothetical protein ACRDNB_02170 [Gaiellaceae bacterium]
MNDLPHDFGTGLRAHLGLEQSETDLDAEPEPAPVAVVPERADVHVVAADVTEDPDGATLAALIAFEDELLERERTLAEREATFAGRAGALLGAAKALYDEVLSGKHSPTDDELARMRRRKSVA